MAHFQCFRTDQEHIRWRLLGGNNRVLGVSARPRLHLAIVLDEIDLVQKKLYEAEFGLEHMPTGPWQWRMWFGPSDVACAAHGFARRVDAALSCERFQRRIPGAEVDRSLVVFQPGRRGREIQPTDRRDGADRGDTVSRRRRAN